MIYINGTLKMVLTYERRARLFDSNVIAVAVIMLGSISERGLPRAMEIIVVPMATEIFFACRLL